MPFKIYAYIILFAALLTAVWIYTHGSDNPVMPSTTPPPSATDSASTIPSPSPSTDNPATPSAFPTTPTPSPVPQSSATSRSCYHVTINGQVFEECTTDGDLHFNYPD